MTREIVGTGINGVIGYSATLFITMEDVNLILGVIVGAATTVYLVCKIIKVIRELRQ